MAQEHPEPDNRHPEDDVVTFAFTHCGTPHEIVFPSDATISEIPAEIEELLSIPAAHQKLLVPRLGLLKLPFKNPEMPVSDLHGASIRLLGSRAEAVESFREASKFAESRRLAREAAAGRRPARRTAGGKGAPLAFLPRPERSLELLNTLKNDPGIRHVMAKHKFTVGLLTEMEPLSNTQVSHEGTTRLLGLNRNQGEVIELRLRTDAHDGYRDYKTIRNTLCHELAHNVHGPHNRDFWDLCHQIEREVASADWSASGRTLGDVDPYGPSMPEDDEAHDEGGWVGGSYVLGGRPDSQDDGLSRREILRRAAEERQRRLEQERRDRGDDNTDAGHS
ncbi:unnamed protein product [Parascedosporium putredinis]|uniref:WLM domain-containing protein n=1 Tax=Parascedosporium putredinis TaxID=1442378 RepID=A0A9P1H5W2_9PEZI|nr:unnamed protein product [Parascedosporium putredinis]CAI7999691.1 unnamed protein product [Parascedosporium putredinis]